MSICFGLIKATLLLNCNNNHDAKGCRILWKYVRESVFSGFSIQGRAVEFAIHSQQVSGMEAAKTSFGAHFGQVSWVVPDIHAAETFFRDVVGIAQFVKMENLRAEELEGTYRGQPAAYSFHLYMAYSGGSMIELIQPVSGESLFQEWLARHTRGGVQHVAYTVPEADFDQAVAELTGKGYPVLASLRLPVARVAFFDTYQPIGVVTEIIGVTGSGVEFINQLRSGVQES